MSARDRVLGKIRGRLEAAGSDLSARRAGVAARLASLEPNPPVPAIAADQGRAAVERFVREAEATLATVSRHADFSELPAALAHELRNRNLGPAIRCGAEPAFAELDWTGVEISQGPGRVDEPATLSRAAAGIAEVGALALLSGPDNPVTLTFLGETHFVVLRAREIVPGFEGLWFRLRARDGLPRTVNLVAGPSRSADIAQKLEIGAHGPLAVHIFLIDDLADEST